MEKLKQVIARLDERAKSPMVQISGMGKELELIRAALVEVDHCMTVHGECLREMATELQQLRQRQ